MNEGDEASENEAPDHGDRYVVGDRDAIVLA
jgi:hypothetical protein